MEDKISGMEELEEKIKWYKIKQILGTGDFSILLWRNPKEERPRNASYVLLKYRDDSGDIIPTEAAYENEQFLYYYRDGSEGVINEDVILGWDYFPYNETLPAITEEEAEILRQLFNRLFGLEEQEFEGILNIPSFLFAEKLK